MAKQAAETTENYNAIDNYNQKEKILFNKKQILSFKQYHNRKDVLAVILSEEEQYTHKQIQNILDNFMKKEVL